MKRITILGAALALAVAACGSDTNAFKRDFNQAQQPLQRLLTDMPAAPAGDKDAYAAKLTELAVGLDGVAASMRKLDAPDDVKDELAAFVAEVDESSDVVRRVAKAVESGEVKRMADALTGLQQQLTRVVEVEQALKAAAG